MAVGISVGLAVAVEVAVGVGVDSTVGVEIEVDDGSTVDLGVPGITVSFGVQPPRRAVEIPAAITTSMTFFAESKGLL